MSPDDCSEHSYLPRMATVCPSCGATLDGDPAVCRKCFHIIDRSRWQHDAGRLGLDERDRGRELNDPPVGPLPVAPGGPAGFAGSFVGSVFKLWGVGRILSRNRRRY